MQNGEINYKSNPWDFNRVSRILKIIFSNVISLKLEIIKNIRN